MLHTGVTGGSLGHLVALSGLGADLGSELGDLGSLSGGVSASVNWLDSLGDLVVDGVDLGDDVLDGLVDGGDLLDKSWKSSLEDGDLDEDSWSLGLWSLGSSDGELGDSGSDSLDSLGEGNNSLSEGSDLSDVSDDNSLDLWGVHAGKVGDSFDRVSGLRASEVWLGADWHGVLDDDSLDSVNLGKKWGSDDSLLVKLGSELVNNLGYVLDLSSESDDVSLENDGLLFHLLDSLDWVESLWLVGDSDYGSGNVSDLSDEDSGLSDEFLDLLGDSWSLGNWCLDSSDLEGSDGVSENGDLSGDLLDSSSESDDNNLLLSGDWLGWLWLLSSD